MPIARWKTAEILDSRFLFGLFCFISFCLKKMNNESTTLISLKESIKRLLGATGREQAWAGFSGKSG